MVECSCICSWACSQVFHLLFCCKDVYTLVFEEPMQATLREFRKTVITKKQKMQHNIQFPPFWYLLSQGDMKIQAFVDVYKPRTAVQKAQRLWPNHLNWHGYPGSYKVCCVTPYKHVNMLLHSAIYNTALINGNTILE